MTRFRMTIDGTPLEAEPGTTVAAALINAGVSRFRTSVGGQPRGPLCAMGVCLECRVTIDGRPHRRACLEACTPESVVESTGTGAPADARTAVEQARVEVAVVGAGPAGIAAACRAAEAGADVLLLDEGIGPGGQIWRHRDAGVLPESARRWLDRLAASRARVRHSAVVIDATPAAGAFRLAVADHANHRSTEVRAARIVVATGARERFLPFPGWTLPNVMGVGAVQALLKSGASFQGKDVVVAGSGPLLLPVAALLTENGARVRRVAEQAPGAAVLRFAAGLWRQPGKLVEAARYRAAFARTPYRPGTWIVAARGERVVEEVTLTNGRGTWTEPCDLLCCAFGLIPNLELPLLLGCAVEGGVVRTSPTQESSVAGVFAAGETTGIAGVDAALGEGQIAGLAAAGRPGDASALQGIRNRGRTFARRLDAAFAPRPELRGLPGPDTLVCRCEDVAYERLTPGWSRRQAKLYTRAGMGPCQGRVCGPALEFLFGWERDSVRAPLSPTPVGLLAGSMIDEGGSRDVSA